MIKRDMSEILLQAAGMFPIVKSCFPKHTYCNLENPETRKLAEEDPKSFFHINSSPMIIDEKGHEGAVSGRD